MGNLLDDIDPDGGNAFRIIAVPPHEFDIPADFGGDMFFQAVYFVGPLKIAGIDYTDLDEDEVFIKVSEQPDDAEERMQP